MSDEKDKKKPLKGKSSKKTNIVPFKTKSLKEQKIETRNEIWERIDIFAKNLVDEFSDDIEEASKIDGCNTLQSIFYIIMPSNLNGILSICLIVFILSWNEFLFAFMFLDDTSLFTLSRGIVSLNSSEVPQQHLMAGAVIATIPVMAIFLYLERFLISGLSSGGVKG